jgi:dTDP-4-amino-4,6-dideoxygalactose transaminase
MTSRTRAVMPVHLFGLPAAMAGILEFARAHRLVVIEDAACALGASLGGRPCGSVGELACFSFHPRKIVTTGEGGAVVTSDEDLAAKVRLLRNHGIRRTPAGMEFELPAFNFRLSDLHAAVGLAQMKQLRAQLELRRELSNAMRAELAGLAWLQPPEEPAGATHGWQSFVVRLAAGVDRAALLDHLGRDAIEAVPAAYALHLTRAFAPLVAPAAPPVSAELHRSTLALPFHPFLRPVELRRIADSLASFRLG